MASNLTITPSSTAAHPVIKDSETTSSVTYTITETTPTANGVTYNITGDDADKFVVTYAASSIDATQKATITLISAANILTQILYKINLVATSVDNPSDSKLLAIGIFVSSASTGAPSASLTTVTNDTSSILELSTTSKARYPLAHTNANDLTNMSVGFANNTGAGLTAALVRQDDGNGVDTNYITLKRTTTGADGGDAAQVTPDVLLTYTGANSGNTLPATQPSYTVTMTLTVNYTPVKIKFFKELTLDNELDSGANSSTATTDVFNYYDGRNSTHSASSLPTVIPDNTIAATKHDIPVYLDQKCTWVQTGADDTDFKIYPDDGSGAIDTTAVLGAAAKVKTAWIRLDRTAVTNYATKKFYTTTLTLTDAGGSSAVDNTQTRTLNITMAVSHDIVIPIINDISFNGTAYAGSISGNAVAFDVDEVAAATEVAKFKMDHTLHGANDLVTGVDFYLEEGAHTCNTLTNSTGSMTVDSVSGGSTATFSVTSATETITTNVTKTASIKVSNITFKDNYTQASDNQYVFTILAKDAVDTTANASDVRLSSVPITVTVTVKNTTGMSYTGQSGTQSVTPNTTDVVSTGVVTNSGTTNASTVEFAFFANIPASAAAPADGTTSVDADKTIMGIILTDAASASQINLVSDVVVSTVTHPNAAMATGASNSTTVKKFAFSVTGMTNAAVYTLTMPTLIPATSHQNVSGTLPAAGAMIDAKPTFVFTYSTTSQNIHFHGPDDVTWARGHPYTETFYKAGEVTSPTAVTAANSTTNILGARYTAVEGNKMSYYNAVDPTAAAGTTGYFTWTVTNAAGGQSSRTRTVTIQSDTTLGYTYTANLVPRSIPTLRSASTTPATATYNLTFAGSTGTATAPLPLNYKDDNAQQNLLGEADFQSGIKADTSPDTNAAGTALAVAYTQELSVSNRGTLWAYLTPGSPGNATFDEIYRVTNEDIYAYNFGDNNTSVTAKTHTFDAETVGPFNVKGASLLEGIAGTPTTYVSKTGTSQTGILTLTLDTNPTDLITDSIYTNVPTTGGSPGSTGATFDVTVVGGTITAIAANAAGTGYDPDDTLRIDHALIGVSAGNTNATVIRQLDTGTKAGWDTLRGKRTVTIIEAAGHIINIELGGLNIDQAIVTAFSLQATADWSSNITVFEDHATCKLKMSKNDFNSVFFYKPETPGMTTPGVGGWSNLLTSRSLRSENIELLQVHTAWPTMKGGDATGIAAGTSHNLHQLNTTLFQDKDPFEVGVPDSSVAIKDVVVENWTYDLFGVKNMADIFSSTPAMKTEIENYLTAPSDFNPVRPQVNATAATNPPTSTLEGAIRLKLKDLSSAENVATRTTNWTGSTDGTTNTGSHLDDTTTIINSRPAQFLLYALHDKIQGTDAAHYRLTTNVGGMFHADNKVTAAGNTKDFFPFIWQAGDMITVGTQFAHDPVTGGSLFNDGGTKNLGNLPFKFVITLV
jgi:hypothetical protein